MKTPALLILFALTVSSSGFASGTKHGGGHKPASVDKKGIEKACKDEVQSNANRIVDKKVADLKKENKNAHYDKTKLLAETKKEIFEDCMKKSK